MINSAEDWLVRTSSRFRAGVAAAAVAILAAGAWAFRSLILVVRPDHTSRPVRASVLAKVKHQLTGVVINSAEDWLVRTSSRFRAGVVLGLAATKDPGMVGAAK